MFNNLYVVKDKKSIRQEIDTLRLKSQKFIEDENLSGELKAFITSFLNVLDIIVMVLLEKQIRKTSRNSGIPPSQDIGSKNDRNNEERSTKSRDTGVLLANTKMTKSELTVSPEKCTGCGLPLEGEKAKSVEVRKELDIYYEIHEKSVMAECKECPSCGCSNHGEFPKGMSGPVQYGFGVKTAVINLLMVQMLSMQRVREHLAGLLGRKISPAAMLRYVATLGMLLRPWEEKMKEELLKSPVIYVDETSIRVSGKLFWIHTYSYGDIVLQYLHPKRGLEAIKEIGILERYSGVIVHDCLSSYFSLENVTHALCLSHLLRELNFIEESSGDKWVTKLKKLLKEAISMVRKRKSKRLTEKEYKRLQRRYRFILTMALKELPSFPVKSERRGRSKHTTAQNLWLRFKKYEEAILLCC